MRNEITTAKIYKEDITLAKELIASINAAMCRVEKVMPTVTITIANMVHSSLKLYAACVRKTMVAFPTIEFEKIIREDYVIPAVIESLAKFGITAKTTRQPDGEAYLMVEPSDGEDDISLDFPIDEKSIAPLMN